MATAQFGEYAAFDTPGGIRFQKNKKMVSRKAVPPEVVEYLERHLGAEQPAVPRVQLSDEEKARLRAESLAVKPELQAPPEKLAEDAARATEVAEQADHLTPEDFDEPTPPVDPQPHEPTPQVQPREEVVTTTDDFPETDEPQVATASVEEQPMSDFLEQVSIHTASLEDIAEALLNRFGIYTVWLRKLPENDEINPLTGEGFTKYHLGIAYQAAIRAQNQGLLELDPTRNRRAIDEGRAASANLEAQFDKQPVTVAENRRANTFDYRTSPVGTRSVAQTEIVHETDEHGVVHAVQRPIVNGAETDTGRLNGAGVGYKEDEDEPLVEPNFSGKPVIRPNW